MGRERVVHRRDLRSGDRRSRRDCVVMPLPQRPFHPSDDNPLTRASAPSLRLGGPGELIDVVPYLLGFHPRDSLVLVGLHGTGSSTGTGRELVGIAARIDLADIAVDTAVIARVADVLTRSGAESAVALVFDDEPHEGEISLDSALPWSAIIDEVEDVCGSASLELRDALLVSPTRWWSYLCLDPGCCPRQGRLRPDGPSVSAAAATYAGLTAVPDRADLERSLEPAPDERRELLRPELVSVAAALALDIGERAGQSRRRGATRALFAAARLRAVAEPGAAAGAQPEARTDTVTTAGPGDTAREHLTRVRIVALAGALTDVSVRDSCWLAIEGRRLPPTSLWSELALAVPQPYDAQPLFLHAWQSWRDGNGTVAGMAAARALRSDPDCSAAQLLLDALAHGLDPRRTPRLRSGPARVRRTY
jgi:hypothetical protein